MGLIKSIGGAIGGTLGDSWKEAITCPAISNDMVIVPGVKMHDGSARSSNIKGTSNTISNGSTINVPESVCMLTIDNGRITNVVTEPGQFVFNNSTAPSIFAGQIGESAKEVIRRFTYGGEAGVEQQVIYINLQRLPGIGFGTGSPVPYDDPRYHTTVNLKFYGTFEVQIADAEAAVKFYTQVASKGTKSGSLSVEDAFENQMFKMEFMQAFRVVLNRLSKRGICYNAIDSELDILCEEAQKACYEKWGERGISLTSVAMGTISLDAKSEERLATVQQAETMVNPDFQRAHLTQAIAKGIESAGANENGAMMGFMGMNMAMGAGNNILGNIPAPSAAASAPAMQGGWKCSCGATNTGAFCSSCGAKKPEEWVCSCGSVNAGKFCPVCGKSKEGDAPQPVANEWVCSCGAKNTGKFCSSCGAQKPAAPKKYKCDKCGWTPADPENPPKFCPECGDPFNEDDLV